MTDSRTAAGLDRLPWLSDEPKSRPRAKGAVAGLLGWVVAAILLIAGASYWLGKRSAERTPIYTPTEQMGQPATTVPLPQPRAAEPVQPEVRADTIPQVEPAPAPAVPAIKQPAPVPKRQRVMRSVPAEPRRKAAPTAEIAASKPEKTKAQPVARKVDPLRPWPVRVKDGASGRLVRVGTFRTARQAKKGWWAIVRMNPALKRLPALVVPAQSLRDGQVYYRLQMGTTSQAHSEVLCQRMRSIGQSCVVIEVYNRGQAAAA